MSLSTPLTVSPTVFQAIQRIDISLLVHTAKNPPKLSLSSSDDEITVLRPVLASLVRMSLIASLDSSAECVFDRTAVLEILSRIELVNNLVALLSIDFHALEVDVRKEQQLRAKVGSGAGESVLIAGLSNGPALEFERSDATRRLRLVLSELLAIMGQIQSQTNRLAEESSANGSTSTSPPSSSVITMRQSELFDHLVYLSEVSDVLCIAMSELPMLLAPPEVAEALLRLKFGPWIICYMVANQPESFNDVVYHLLKNGDKQDDEGSNRIRQKAICLLCDMNPTEIANVRQKCIEWCRMPSLALQLTYELNRKDTNHDDDNDDLVSFMSGLLLGSDPQIRSWISFFVRNGQKKRHENLMPYRSCLLDRLQFYVNSCSVDERGNKYLQKNHVIKALALLRLYTALRGIAGMKFSDQEIPLLFDLITSRPPATPSGVKFVSLGLSMLIACNSIISASQQLEKRAVEWIRWLVKEEDDYERRSGVSASFGEMLLLMAIHFHSNQLNAICDLVWQTLGMKIPIRPNSSTRMKTIFTQEIFTEQVVAAHAVRVPVTKGLSADMTGYLPVHCIHQLLKSRAFSKHQVPIKDWIYRQISVSSTTLHPVLPALIDVYVNSILVPATSRGIQDQTNEPISEMEVNAIFETLPKFTKVDAVSPQNRKRNSLLRSRESTPALDLDEKRVEIDPMAPQILMLYYVLLYENVRLSHMRNILSSQRKILIYSNDLFAKLPIKYLLQRAEREQEKFGSIFPQLLKLCSTRYPHLCLVQDWLEDGSQDDHVALKRVAKGISVSAIQEAFEMLTTCPSKLTLIMQKLFAVPKDQLWKYAHVCVHNMDKILETTTSRKIRETYKRLWFEFNKIHPRQLWVETAISLLTEMNVSSRKRMGQDDLILDPLQILRCDRRAFRVGPILEIVLYILKACLAASRTHLAQHILDHPIIDRGQNQGQQVSNDLEREELKNALVATQESAAIQILLEAILPNESDENIGSTQLTDVKEAQRLICSYLHEAFITDPNLAKLVHFQGYPLELLPVTVSSVPSMHICLDFAPELLGQPDLEKQVFAVDLISHLSVQYALPKSYSMARLAVNSLSTLLSVLSAEERNQLFEPVLPSFVRICRAFPPLVDDSITLLIQYGKMVVSESCLNGYSNPRNMNVFGGNQRFENYQRKEEVTNAFQRLNSSEEPIATKVMQTLQEIVRVALIENNNAF